MTAPALNFAHKSTSHSDIARFLCQIARMKPQDDNAGMAYGMALKLDPRCAEAWNGMGRVEMGRGRTDAAIDAFTQAIDINPKYAEAFLHRGVALDRIGLSSAGIRDLEQSVALDPSLTIAELQMFGILENQDRAAEAMKVLEEALLKRPDDHDLLFARATLEFGAGDFVQGWKDYESRPTKVQLSEMLDEYPEWDGVASLQGKRIVVCREQGLGDEIMFARLVPELAKRGAHVILYCYPALARLFASISYAWWDVRSMTIWRTDPVEIVTTDADVPEFDYWVAMGSLPLKLGLPLDPAPYLKVADPEPKTGAFRVGLCWQGNKSHARDAYRSIPFAALSPLLAVEGIEFVSLQQNDEESGLEAMSDRCHDLYDLAREMGSLDLVITVDTAVAHLAGALGIPCWVLLGKPADWRWNLPLYDSVNIYRNEAPKRWSSLIEERASVMAVHAFCSGKHPCSPQPSVPANSPQSVCPPAPAIATTDTRYGRMQYFTRDIWLGRSLALYGEWSEGECDLYRKVVGPNDVVVEVGANIGAHTVVLAEISRTIFAFEPNKESFGLLRDNIPHTTAILVNKALGAIEGSGTLRTKLNNPGGTEIEFGGGDIDVWSLDDLSADNYIPHVEFLKLDCEGSELEVLQGAVETIARCRPLLYAENDRADKSEALIAWIHEHGYRMYRHHTPLYNPDNFRGYKINVFGNIVSAMLFCVPTERKDLRPTEWGMGMERVRIRRG